MTLIIEGAQNVHWVVPEWIARNAIFFLVPELSKITEAQPIAERLVTAMEQRASFISLSEFLQKPATKKVWQDAVDRAEQTLAAEDPEDWNDPQAYEPFCSSFHQLRTLAET